MATYYGSVFIPTANVSDTFDFTFLFSTNSYTPPTGTIDNFATTAADIENLYDGNLTFTWYTVSGGKRFTLTYDNPDVIPVSFVMASVDEAVVFIFPFAEVLECSGCGDVEWAECEEDYVIDLGLEESTTYNYTFTHNQTGIQYTQTGTTNGSGITTWDTYLKPELYVSGNVYVLTATNGSEDVMFTYNGTRYSCMQITMVKQTNITD
jgi:hypothetical protein